jgi:EF-hand domain pair
MCTGRQLQALRARARHDVIKHPGSESSRQNVAQALKLHTALSKQLARYREVLGQYGHKATATPVSFEEFEAYVRKASAKMCRAFERLDSEHSGALTESGLLAALRTMGFSAQREDALRMIELLDRNHNRQISFAEFVHFACLLPERQVANGNVAACWVDSADFVDGLEARLNMVRARPGARVRRCCEHVTLTRCACAHRERVLPALQPTREMCIDVLHACSARTKCSAYAVCALCV